MARARNIKPGLPANAELAECSIWARYLFALLPTIADREGRLEDRPKQIKGELLRFDEQPVEPLLAELAERRFIIRYQNSAGRWIQITKFWKHQTPHYSEKASVIKPPTLQEWPAHERAQNPGNRGDEGSESPGEHQETSGELLETESINRGSQPPDSLIPDSGFLIPSSLIADSPIPDTGEKQPLSPGVARKPRSPRRGNGADAPPKTSQTWSAYSEAYRERYGVDPVRNATVNGQLAQVVKQLGLEEAPAVARFYLSHSRSVYVGAKHAVNLLLRDCTGLRTEWATGNRVTETSARQADRTATTGDVFAKLIAEAEQEKPA